MSANDHIEYYRERARRERELASAAPHPKAAAAHSVLADVYEALVANGQRSTARILRPDFQKCAAVSCEKSGRLAGMETEG